MNHLNTRAIYHRSFLPGLLLLVIMLTACASTPMAPVDSLDAARNAITNAEQAGAGDHAGPELEEARSRLGMAEEAVADENMTSADQLAQQSRIKAELALARTEAANAAAINRETERRTTDMQRQGEPQ